MAGDDFNSILGGLPPGALEQLLQLGGLGEQQDDLSKQMEMARALRGQPMEHHVSPWGAAFGGLGHMLDVYNSYNQEKGLKGQVQDVRDQQTHGRNLLVDLLRGGPKPQPQQPGYAPLLTPPPGSFGI